MAFEVIVDDFNRDEWERCAKEFSDYNIYQTWPYQQVRAETDGQELSRVIIKDENSRVVTMCHVRIKHVKLLGLRIGYIQWGPLFRDKEGRVVCSVEALSKLREVYLPDRVNVLRVVPIACDDADGRVFAGMLRSAGFGRVRDILPYHTFMLPTDDSEEGIRRGLSKSFRRNLKKAGKAGVQVRHGSDGSFCRILVDLYSDCRKRKGFKGVDPEEFIRTQALLSDGEKMNIVVVYVEGEPVSVLLSSNLGDTGLVLLAATNGKGLTCGASYTALYRGALAAMESGMKLYDLGGIDPENNPKVYEFKSRMGGEEVFHIGTFEICNNWVVKKFWHMAEKVYENIRK